ncbi:hypothetical protein Si038_00748 [Streptococcus infantarius subsp. infantarius]|nr:hypothetical protein [Streptococcus infantarius subsp. infantarius]
MSRYTDYKYASNILKGIENKPEKYLIIHYSCESFYNLGGKSPRIASISVRQFNNAQTNNFSIHQYSEMLNIPITDDTYRDIEKKLLTDFFTFVDKNLDKIWIHWNMRDSVFGFNAIEQRFRVLGGKPQAIDNDKKIDLGHLFKLLYGGDYIENPHIEKLLELNKFNPKQFLNGKQEAEAFDNSEYVKLSMSTSSKVNLFSTFVTHAINQTLKTRIPNWKIRGTNFAGLLATFQDMTSGKIIFWLVNTIIAGIIGAWISKYF